MATRPNPDFNQVHAELKAILKKYEGKGLQAGPDTPENYILTGPPSGPSKGKPVWFGSVQRRKNYVSYHLMPVYVDPRLLEGISPGLKKRMQGKSCFNFKTVDKELFAELASLTDEGYEYFKREKWIR
jgi:hypothetical protein